MSENKPTGTANSMPMTGSSCGIKPTQEALEKGYTVDFSKAKALLEDDIKEQIKGDKSANTPTVNSKSTQS